MMRFLISLLAIFYPLASQAQVNTETWHCLSYKTADGLFMDVNNDTKTIEIERYYYYGSTEDVRLRSATITKAFNNFDFHAESELRLKGTPARTTYFFDYDNRDLFVSNIAYKAEPIVIETTKLRCIETRNIKTLKRQ